jgi:hypothetical protein
LEQDAMIKQAGCWMILMLGTSLSGCFYIPMWKVPTPPCCQAAENHWGCVVDTIGHQSPIDQPCHDPHYVKRAVYRVPPYGVFEPPVETFNFPPPVIDAPLPE